MRQPRLVRVRIGVRLRVRVRVRVRGLTLTLTLTLTPTLSLTLTGAPRYLDLRDQHDEPQQFCAGIVFQRLPHAAVKWITPFAAPHICWPRAAEENLSCAQEAHVSTRATRLEVVTPRAEPPMAGQVVRKAPAKEAVAAGTAARAAAAAMESLWSVARGTIPAHKVEQWQNHRSKLPWIRFGEAGTASPARLISLASATTRKHDHCIVSCCGVMM